MRQVAAGRSCGFVRPAARRDQAATCFLAEVGNGDKFLFDVGTGSMTNVAALMIPYDFLDKVFLTHLHTDHWGDLATLWAGGWTSTRAGLQLGGSVENTHVSPAEKFNRAAWGEDYDLKSILSRPGGELESAQELREALVKATRTSFEM